MLPLQLQISQNITHITCVCMNADNNLICLFCVQFALAAGKPLAVSEMFQHASRVLSCEKSSARYLDGAVLRGSIVSKPIMDAVARSEILEVTLIVSYGLLLLTV